MKITKNKVKELAKLNQKKYRELSRNVVVEGVRLIEQINHYGIELEELYSTERFQNNSFLCKNNFEVTEQQLQKITDTKNPQPIAALVQKKKICLKDNNFILYLDGIKEPGNLGTIIRTATALNVDGIILSPNCCELYNPKVIRASLGTVFQLPIEIHGIEWLKKSDATIVSTAMKNAEKILAFSKPQKIILVIGSEAFGVSDEILAISHKTVKIPISKNIESLNVAVATGIAIFQINR
ncbi:MAG: RNA methyltransferase [Candidatus Cloacimonetes bacterium]|jgi:RNA methyltransferase, TrmH family|nr:RNA methyltransferase [Candidatus Cloacimonadota bacterium]MBT6993884.1 RNA methyltransferase [Candidatus Cloacimonadota bacterium]MBT7469034.1 RNA methyltransferase [Candidatus Cloacimonadota bacterium]